MLLLPVGRSSQCSLGQQTEHEGPHAPSCVAPSVGAGGKTGGVDEMKTRETTILSTTDCELVSIRRSALLEKQSKKCEKTVDRLRSFFATSPCPATARSTRSAFCHRHGRTERHWRCADVVGKEQNRRSFFCLTVLPCSCSRAVWLQLAILRTECS